MLYRLFLETSKQVRLQRNAYDCALKSVTFTCNSVNSYELNFCQVKTSCTFMGFLFCKLSYFKLKRVVLRDHNGLSETVSYLGQFSWCLFLGQTSHNVMNASAVLWVSVWPLISHMILQIVKLDVRPLEGTCYPHNLIALMTLCFCFLFPSLILQKGPWLTVIATVHNSEICSLIWKWNFIRILRIIWQIFFLNWMHSTCINTYLHMSSQSAKLCHHIEVSHPAKSPASCNLGVMQHLLITVINCTCVCQNVKDLKKKEVIQTIAECN